MRGFVVAGALLLLPLAPATAATIGVYDYMTGRIIQPQPNRAVGASCTGAASSQAGVSTTNCNPVSTPVQRGTRPAGPSQASGPRKPAF